jgi:hypothetical protein
MFVLSNLRNRFFLLVLIATLFAVSASAQLANTTTITGTVTDSSGASIAGVAVKAINSATSDTYDVQTSADGNFTIPFVRNGLYKVTASKDGFSTVSQDNVQVNANEVVRANFSLQVGSITQNVVVTAAPPAIATDNADVKETVSQRAAVELPLNGRNVLSIATSVPGVLPGMKGSNGNPPGEGYIASGTREIQNVVTLDGVSIMNNLIMTTPYHPSPDAVQEMEVQTGTYTAQYGGYLGAHLNVVTKSGGNDFHGAIFEFLRNDKLNARNYFANPAQPKPTVRQNQFGLVVTGPVMIPKLYDGRKKTFFMFDYEGLRGNTQASSAATVLTSRMRNGDFSELLPATQLKDPLNGGVFAGNQIPTARLSQQALNALQYMSLPTVSGVQNNLLGNAPNNDRFNQAIGRIDQNLGDKTRLFFRYAWADETFVNNGNANFSGLTTLPVETKNWVIGWTQTITPNLINDIHFGHQALSTNALNYWYTNNLTTAGTDLGIPGFNADAATNSPGIPYFNITNYVALGNSGTNWFQTDASWHGTDAFTWVHGAHTVIAGVEFLKLITGRQAVNAPMGQFNFTGAYTGNAAADLMLGYINQTTTPTAQVRNIVAQWRDGFYVTDKWTATRRLTLDLGLRYELPTVPYTKNGYATILNPDQTALLPANAPVPGFSLTGTNHNNWAPRLGLAYRISDRTTLRAGYGIYYNPNQNNSFTFLSQNPPFGTVLSYNGTTGTPNLLLNAPVAGSAGRPPITIYTPNFYLPTGTLNQWSAGLSQSIWSGGAFEIQYVGSQSSHLDRSYYSNRPAPGPGSVQLRRPNQLWGDIRTIQNDETASYHGVSFTYRQRLSHGLTALASYTWSHTLDVGTDSNGGGQPMDPYDWRRDYGNSNWDIRHRFVSNFNYELPFFKSSSNGLLRSVLGGWQANGIITAQSGMPFNVVMGGDNANTGTSGLQRPNLVGLVSANCDGSNPRANCVNLTGFQQAAQYTFGNAGRNILRGPGYTNINFSGFKNFTFKERFNLQFRAEFFNLFNTPIFNNPNATLPLLTDTTTYTAANIQNFGTITSTRQGLDNRQIQFALKFLF